MLDATLATTFTPGTNLKGSVAGANWSFLLPSLEVEHVVAFGVPAKAALATLARLGNDVTIICKDATQYQHSNKLIRELQLTNVRPQLIADPSRMPLANHSVDVLFLAEQDRWLPRSREARLEYCRVLKPDGLLYFERGNPVEHLRARTAIRELVNSIGTARTLWLTPLHGEMHTAVPTNDRQTINWFFQHKLYSSSIMPWALRLVDRLMKRPTGQASAPGIARVNLPGLDRKGPKRLDQLKRSGGARFLRFVEDSEQLVGRRNKLMQRYGVLVSRAPSDQRFAPPRYLRALAEQAGIDICQQRWGLSARGEYSSRKVLFFLFDGGNRDPQYIVKMTRDSSFNARLTTECHALKLLHNKLIRQQETLPQVAFFGYHNHLAIVGETAIQGVPFAERTTSSADCPYAGRALNWLMDLAIATVDRTATTALEVAEGLQHLLNRFVQIYDPSPEHRAFLAEQVRLVAQHTGAFPAVFQHGDPGTWNVMVTKNEQVAFLDWEAAEPQGMPLWDLFYFIRSYSGDIARARGIGNRVQGFAQQLLATSPLNDVFCKTVQQYCAALDLPQTLIAPLFYTCWMHRALKEATRLTPDTLQRGLYVTILRLCIEQRSMAGLQRLFATNSN